MRDAGATWAFALVPTETCRWSHDATHCGHPVRPWRVRIADQASPRGTPISMAETHITASPAEFSRRCVLFPRRDAVVLWSGPVPGSSVDLDQAIRTKPGCHWILQQPRAFAYLCQTQIRSRRKAMTRQVISSRTLYQTRNGTQSRFTGLVCLRVVQAWDQYSVLYEIGGQSFQGAWHGVLGDGGSGPHRLSVRWLHSFQCPVTAGVFTVMTVMPHGCSAACSSARCSCCPG